MKRTGIAFLAISGLWGSEWIATGTLLHDIPAFLAGALRYGIASIVLGLATVLVRRFHRKRPRSAVSWRTHLLLAASGLAAPWILAVLAAGQTPAGVTATIESLLPLAALLVGSGSDSRRIPLLATGAGGIAIVVSGALHVGLHQWAGIALLFAAVLLQAYFLVEAKRRLAQADLLASSAIQCALAAGLCGVAAALVPGGFSVHATLPGGISLVLWALAGTCVMVPLLYWLLQRLSADRVALAQWFALLLAIAEAAALWREPIRREMLSGAAITLVCAMVLVRECHVTAEVTEWTHGR